MTRFFVFHGRASRLLYLMVTLLLAALTWSIDTYLTPLYGFGVSPWVLPVVVDNITAFVLTLLCTWLGICMAVQRLHDLNFSGWWVLLSLIPLVSWIFALVLFVVKGTPGPNRFGPDPLALEAA